MSKNHILEHVINPAKRVKRDSIYNNNKEVIAKLGAFEYPDRWDKATLGSFFRIIFEGILTNDAQLKSVNLNADKIHTAVLKSVDYCDSTVINKTYELLINKDVTNRKELNTKFRQHLTSRFGGPTCDFILAKPKRNDTLKYLSSGYLALIIIDLCIRKCSDAKDALAADVVTTKLTTDYPFLLQYCNDFVIHLTSLDLDGIQFTKVAFEIPDDYSKKFVIPGDSKNSTHAPEIEYAHVLHGINEYANDLLKRQSKNISHLKEKIESCVFEYNSLRKSYIQSKINEVELLISTKRVSEMRKVEKAFSKSLEVLKGNNLVDKQLSVSELIVKVLAYTHDTCKDLADRAGLEDEYNVHQHKFSFHKIEKESFIIKVKDGKVLGFETDKNK